MKSTDMSQHWVESPFIHSTEPFPVFRTRLDNGLRVWCQPRSDSKSVVLLLILRTGARYETSENSGISHFLEHMIFTGSERWEENEIKEVITRRGGQWNGWTGPEETTYYAEVSAGDFSLAMDWLAEVVFHARIPADKVEKERKVIFQEKSGKYGWLLNKLEEWGFGYDLDRRIEGVLFPESTITNRIIGEDHSLERITHEDLLNHYRRFYIPNNAQLIVAGNVGAEEVLTTARRYFGDLEPGGDPEDFPSPAVPRDGPHRLIVRGPLLTDQCSLSVGTRTTGLMHPDGWALDVLSEMLQDSLTEEIRYRQGLVYELAAYNTAYTDAGYFEVVTRSERSRRRAIHRVINEQIDALSRGNIDAGKLRDAKTAITGRWSLTMEKNYSRAAWLSNWAFILPDMHQIPDFESHINRITVADIQRVVETYFQQHNRFWGLHLAVFSVKGALKAIAAIVLLAMLVFLTTLFL